MRNDACFLKRLLDRVVDVALNAVISPIVIPVGAAVVAFATDTLDAIEGFYSADQCHFVLWSFVMFAVGVGAGMAFQRLLRRLATPRPRKLTEEQTFAELRHFFRTCDPWLKVFVKTVHEKDEAFTHKTAWDSGFGGYVKVLEDSLVIPETLPDGRVSLKPADALRRFFKKSGGVFDVVSEENMEARAVYDPERRSFPSFVRSGEPRWWWYADGPVSNVPITALAHKRDAADGGGRDRAAGRPRRWNVFDATPEDFEEAERLRKEAEERDEAACIASLDFWEKALLKTALTKRNVYCSSGDFRQMQSCGAGISFEDYPVTVGHGVVRIEMTEERRGFLERHPEALEAVRDEDVAEHEAGRLPKYRDRNAEGFSVDPDWWYYDDEQEDGSRDEACRCGSMNLPRFRLRLYAAFPAAPSGWLVCSSSSGLRHPGAKCVLTLLRNDSM